ncbi:MAG: undecaprenyldiphospho-muramoylpentapeptide beta-N-acetylglucosaminyltransferase [Clostridia bacterium]|nr:undecaprenyldiphospho-muramoylpentapeptide beta-N-acetylglucosaminyltransferase [Clostridia bacterium]
MKVIISAAGTGGHINPGIAIANKIKEHEPDSEIVFFGTDRGLENDLVPRAGYKLKTIEAHGIQPKLTIKNIKQIIRTMGSAKIVKKFIDEFKPDIVIGTGGYICGPVFSAANAKKIPTILHESNAFPGKAVKMFAKKADKVLVGFEEAKNKLPNLKNVVVTGTPTKIKKLNISEEEKKKVLSNFGLNANLPVILIFGGSQGAQRINEAVSDLVINNQNSNYQLIWATGPKQFDIFKQKLKANNLDIENIKNAKILPYIYNMEELINICDLVVCRSGAMTITEIAIVEKPAIFIPLPSVRANRQEDNARVLEKLNAAKVILNADVNNNILNDYINEMISDKSNLIKMGKNASSIAVKDVEEKIYEEIKKVIK